MKLRDQVSVGETITLQSDDEIFVGVGPNFKLTGGRVILNVRAQDLFFHEPCDLIDCEVYAKRKLVNYQSWNMVALRRCRITGWFTGNDFGHWETGPQSVNPITGRCENYGVVEDCDFTEAVLDGIRFLNCDMSRIKLPGWPHFSVLNPSRISSIVNTITWPGTTSILAGVIAASDYQVSAVTRYGPEICRRFKCSEAELKEAAKLLNSV